jgi:hypothetical protein
MAVVQLRNPTQGRAYVDRKVAAGKPRWKRCKRSNGGCPTSSTTRCSLMPRQQRRVREALGDLSEILHDRPDPDSRLFV